MYGRVNEFHVETLFALFLPYHESPHFTKMLTILHIKCAHADLPSIAILTWFKS